MYVNVCVHRSKRCVHFAHEKAPFSLIFSSFWDIRFPYVLIGTL